MDQRRTVKPNLASSIRDSLQEDIESGKLPPGTPLDERAIAAQFSVSRTPVREALQQLAAQNLVHITPRQGVVVSRLSVPQLRDMLELLGELEALCAKLAARRASEELRASLESVLQQGLEASQSGNVGEYSNANLRFHEVIYAGSRNELLAQQVRPLRRLIQRYNVNNRQLQTPTQIEDSMRAHRKIADAIMTGDEALAYRLMLEHVPVGASGFSEFLSSLPASFFE
ncbi:GntR family transcriptional regulator [Aromatoleum aromaticum]|uniref:Transcriptional regulator n=1 Tax=Aromatoleum aromaticum (strain DSM 19018 / LMG 30748 / EbN1) TaxID=76114 RepID=Q5P020_AROAE|nr:GntR family transcriptional regulator [Aromatoleum aromaticum]NMG54842.1 FCD domain-containing protein [Aromatoleum aromaticum]CAI09344.1 transcriptional regulator [Aromatoleum aromaticum EbN1]